MNFRDNRRFTRRSMIANINVIDGSSGEKIKLPSTNISPGGLFLESDLLYEVGEQIWLSFTLPGVSMSLRTRGKIVWVHKYPDDGNPKDQAGMGVEFLDLSDAEQAALGAYLYEN